MHDDNKRLSNKIRQFGAVWDCGEQAGAPRAFRILLCTDCHSEKYDRLRLTQIEEKAIDLLVYVLTGLPPDLKMVDFGTMIKGEMRGAIRRTHQNLGGE